MNEQKPALNNGFCFLAWVLYQNVGRTPYIIKLRNTRYENRLKKR